MSRIFDALQRSGTEQSGVEYPDMVSVATEVFEAPRRPASADEALEERVRAFHEIAVEEPAAADFAAPEPAVQIPAVQCPSAQSVAQAPVVPAEAPSQESVAELPAFPSLEVSVTPASRLV